MTRLGGHTSPVDLVTIFAFTRAFGDSYVGRPYKEVFVGASKGPRDITAVAVGERAHSKLPDSRGNCTQLSLGLARKVVQCVGNISSPCIETVCD
jgi:hypothetical protein